MRSVLFVEVLIALSHLRVERFFIDFMLTDYCTCNAANGELLQSSFEGDAFACNASESQS